MTAKNGFEGIAHFDRHPEMLSHVGGKILFVGECVNLPGNFFADKAPAFQNWYTEPAQVSASIRRLSGGALTYKICFFDSACPADWSARELKIFRREVESINPDGTLTPWFNCHPLNICPEKIFPLYLAICRGAERLESVFDKIKRYRRRLLKYGARYNLSLP